MVDVDDNLWVAANQADEIVVLDTTGKVIAKLGDFDGLDQGGAARPLLPGEPREERRVRLRDEPGGGPAALRAGAAG